MKLYAPQYYKNFVCIADRCKHSCCIGWEIDVDCETAEKYKKMTEGYGKEIQKSISKRGTPHFKLKKDDRCPHLDESGLCRIILNFGEDCLCHICREHPRFYNYVAGRKEVGIGISCEEACRIILEADNYQNFVEICEIDEEFDEISSDLDAVSLRSELYCLLCDRSIPYSERLFKISEKFDVFPSRKTDEEWRELLLSLEYLEEDHKELLSCYSSNTEPAFDLEVSLERALAYFIFRHCSSAESESEFRSALGFSLFCERLLASICQNRPDFISEAARIISEELEYSEENTESIKLEFAFL